MSQVPHTVAEWDAMSPEEQDALIASGWHPGPGSYSERALQVRYARRDRDYWKQRAKELEEQLHAEQRDRNFWAANNSRARQYLEEQLEAARRDADQLGEQADLQGEECQRLREQLQTYEKALRWIERCAYDHHQQHTMFTHIQRRAMAVLNPAKRPT